MTIVTTGFPSRVSANSADAFSLGWHPITIAKAIRTVAIKRPQKMLWVTNEKYPL
jgi:hypothetical protein